MHGSVSGLIFYILCTSLPIATTMTLSPIGPMLCSSKSACYCACVSTDYNSVLLKCSIHKCRNRSVKWKTECNHATRKDGVGSDTRPEKHMLLSSRHGRIVVKDAVRRHFDTSFSHNMTIHKTNRNKIDTSSLDINVDRCYVLSMTTSQLNPDLMYVLLTCTNIIKCYRILTYVHIGNLSMTRHGLELCEKMEGTRQITPGTCLKERNQSCLYSINTASKLYIYSYKEQNLLTHSNKPDTVHWFMLRSFGNGGLMCSFYKDTQLLCFTNDGRMCRVHLDPNKIYLTMVLMKLWKLPSLSSVSDVAFIGDTTEMIVVTSSQVKVVLFDFEERVISEETSINVTGHTFVWYNNSILVHSRKLDGPFVTLTPS